MKYIYPIGFISIFVVVFYFIMWLLNKMADGDISRIFRWNKFVYFILTLLSILMWLFEAVKFNTWLDPKKNFYIVLSGINIIYVLMLLLVWFANSKSKIRNQVTTMNYGIIYHKTRVNFTSENVQSRIMMMFVLSLVVNPIVNIAFIVFFIKSNF